VIPNEAIQHGPNGLYTFVIGDGNKVEMRNIKVGDEGATQSAVKEGLSGGEQVVVAGQYRLTQGAVVKARTQNAGPPATDKQAINTSQKAP
jgi:multidrug efflux system membrane fusion protein